jgi:hypothetical protein
MMTNAQAQDAGASRMTAKGHGKQGKRQLRNFLLDPVQLRYTAILVLTSACLMGGLGAVAYLKAHEATETALVTVSVSIEDPGTRDQIVRSFKESDRNLVLTIAVFGLALCAFLTVYGIVITHKVAGPLHKLSLHCDAVRDGRLAPLGQLRKGDQLTQFFEHFKAMHEALRARTHAEIAALDAAMQGIEQPELLDKLRALKKAKEDSLG